MGKSRRVPPGYRAGRRPIRIHKLVKTPRPGGDRRGPQTQYTTSYRNVPPGYKISSTTSGKKAYHDLKASGAIFVKPKTRKPRSSESSQFRMPTPGTTGGYVPSTQGPSQYMIDHGYVVNKDTGQMLYDQMSKRAPAQQRLKKWIERQGNVAIWNEELNRWVTL